MMDLLLTGGLLTDGFLTDAFLTRALKVAVVSASLLGCSGEAPPSACEEHVFAPMVAPLEDGIVASDVERITSGSLDAQTFERLSTFLDEHARVLEEGGRLHCPEASWQALSEYADSVRHLSRISGLVAERLREGGATGASQDAPLLGASESEGLRRATGRIRDTLVRAVHAVGDELSVELRAALLSDPEESP